MNDLTTVAPAFVAMAHRIVWCSAATVDTQGRPRSRILHPIWQWDGSQLVGWIATMPTATKRAHLEAHPYISLNYWEPSHSGGNNVDAVSWATDLETRARVWDMFLHGPAPVGYDPAIIPGWDSYQSESFVALRLAPWQLRVSPGTVLLGQGGEVLSWRA